MTRYHKPSIIGGIPPRSPDIREMSPCPACGSNLEDVANAGFRTIGIYDVDKDRTVQWMCPDCGSRWVRGGEEDPFVTFAKKVRREAGIKDGT